VLPLKRAEICDVDAMIEGLMVDADTPLP